MPEWFPLAFSCFSLVVSLCVLWFAKSNYDRIKVPDWYRDTQVPSTAAAPMVRSTSAGDAVVHRIRVPDYGTELIPMLCDCKDGQHGTAQFSGEKSMNRSDPGQT